MRARVKKKYEFLALLDACLKFYLGNATLMSIKNSKLAKSSTAPPCWWQFIILSAQGWDLNIAEWNWTEERSSAPKISVLVKHVWWLQEQETYCIAGWPRSMQRKSCEIISLIEERTPYSTFSWCSECCRAHAKSKRPHRTATWLLPSTHKYRCVDLWVRSCVKNASAASGTEELGFMQFLAHKSTPLSARWLKQHLHFRAWI